MSEETPPWPVCFIQMKHITVLPAAGSPLAPSSSAQGSAPTLHAHRYAEVHSRHVN